MSLEDGKEPTGLWEKWFPKKYCSSCGLKASFMKPGIEFAEGHFCFNCSKNRQDEDIKHLREEVIVDRRSRLHGRKK